MPKDYFKYLRPVLVTDDEMFNLRSNMLNTISIVIIIYVIFLAIFQVFTSAIPALVFNLDLLLIPFMVLSRFLYSQGRLELSGLMILISGFIINTAIIFTMGTIYGPATPVYLILIIFCGLFYGRGGVIASVIVSSILVLGLMEVDLFTTFMPDIPTLRSDPFPSWITFTLVFFVSGLILESTVVKLGTSLSNLKAESNLKVSLMEQQRLLLAAIDQNLSDIVLTDAEGVVKYANSRYLADTGLALDKIVGKNMRDSDVGLMTYDDNEKIWLELSANGFYRGESSHINAQGQVKYFDTTISRVVDEKGKIGGFIAVSTDQTEQKNSLKLQETVFSITAAAQNITKAEDLYPVIHQKMCDVMDARNFYIALYDREIDLLTFKYLVDEIDDLIPEPYQPTTSLTARILKTGKPLRLIGDELANTEGMVVLGPLPKSWLGVPLLVDGKPIGVMAVQNYSNPQAYSATDEKVMEFFSVNVVGTINKIKAAEELSESTLRLSQMAENITEAFWITAADGNFEDRIYLNNAIEKISGLSLEQIYKDRDVLVRQMRPQYQAEFSRVLQLQKIGIVTSFVFQIEHQDGSIHWVTENSFPVLGEGGKHLRTTGYAMEITEEMDYKEKLKTLNEELEQRVASRTNELQLSRDELRVTNSALEKASRMKDEFLASMSHELRTPLTGILGLSEALQYQTYGQLTEKQVYVIKNIELSGRHLLDLINDILDVSKLEADKLDIELTDCLVSDLCNASLQLTKGMAHQKKIQVDFSMDHASMVIKADSKRVKQMLVNLLSNAIKFTPVAGKIGLDVRGDVANNAVSFIVWDTGIGINPEDHDKLFKPFVQLDASLSRQQTGTGLGLVLVMHLAELHGGSIRFESKVGEGSRFTITLPWTESNQNENGEVVSTQAVLRTVPLVLENTGPSKGSLVLIDDNTTILEGLSDFLTVSGYTVFSFSNGPEALTNLSKIDPDVVITDIQMPGMDGLEVTRLLRGSADKALAMVPIIALTALAMPGDEEKCLAAGANVYMAKPVSLAVLLLELDKLIPT